MPVPSFLSRLPVALAALAASAAIPARAEVFRVTEGGRMVTETPYGAQPPARPSVRQPQGWAPPPAAPAAAPAVALIGSPAPGTTAGTRAPRTPPPELRPHFQAAAAQFGLSESLLNAVAFTESRFQARAVSPAGALGVMQLMPGTARDLGVDPADPVQNVMGGARYLRYLLDLFGNNLELALAGYNAGPGAVLRHKGIPPYRETRSYVRQVISRLADEAAAEGR